ncbi:uncharacterized protein LOC128215602 [Mya arenaria]|uniref:uncharacterized protein LOC128215602 n=1 Tax=Mya arenaria TaxID=6604 RepID=UPI0022E92331|nr:uncharacterized protein LOC128215602 [Mya arenaria]
MVKALSELTKEENDNHFFDCLRKVDVEVFVGLSNTEALFISSWHNSRCEQKPTIFQDKVRVARKYFMNGENDWRDQVVVALGHLDRKVDNKRITNLKYS